MKNLNIKGQNIFVDDEDFEILSAISWNPCGEKRQYYSRQKNIGCNEKPKREYLHRFILNAKDGEVVDHINGYKFDNRKQNLRICSGGQNAMNQKIQRRTKGSIFKGVGLHKSSNKIRAYIKINKISKQIGLFKNEYEAAFAYDIKAFELFGKFARPNLACSILHTININ